MFMAARWRGRSETHRLAPELARARSYRSWRSIAEAYDGHSGATAWRDVEQSSLYDFEEIRRRHDRLEQAIERDDWRQILFLLNEGVHGNMGGMGSSALYARSLVGTKRLVECYIDLMGRGLDLVASAPESQISRVVKLDFLHRAQHCYGRSALMLSGGAGLIYFHHGVVEELVDHGLLPNVISGASAGGWICVQLGALDDDELRRRPFDTQRYAAVAGRGLRGLLAEAESGRLQRYREELVDGFCPDMTFQEAYEHTGRYINISVAASEAHQKSRSLNAITSPNVTLRSAAMATSAVPGFVEPVQLEAKDGSGATRAYLPGRRWVDGSMSDDLPARCLSRLFGVNHYIVSLINPMALPFVKPPDPRRHEILRSIDEIRHSLTKEVFRLAGSRRNRLPFLSRVGELMEGAYGMVDQQYTGDVNLVLEPGEYSWRNVLFQYEDDGQIESLIRAGRRAVWPNVDLIRNNTFMSRKLDALLLEFEQPDSSEDGYLVR